jgi:hypothetical protein
LEEDYKFPKEETEMGFGKFICSATERAKYSRKRLCAIGCESENVEVQWNDISKCLLPTMGKLVRKVENNKKRNPWLAQEMIRKMEERRKRKNVNNEEGGENYGRMKNELKRAIDKAKREYRESKK